MKLIKSLLALASVASVLTIAMAVHADDKKVGVESRGGCDHAGPIHGGDGPVGDEHEGGWHQGRSPFDKILSLTDAQKKILHDNHTQQESSMRDFHEKMRSAHDALEKATETGASEEDIANLANDFAALVAQQEIHRAKMHQQLISILTPEQKQTLLQWEAEHKDREHKHPNEK